MKMISYFKSHAIILIAIILLSLIVMNTAIIGYNNEILKETNRVKAETQQVIALTDLLWSDVVKNIDLGLRGYALLKNEKLLDPFNKANVNMDTIVRGLNKILTTQDFPDKQAVQEINIGIANFLKDQNFMLELIKMDSIDQFKKILEEDRGYTLWLIYDKNSRKIKDFEDHLYQTAYEEYESATLRTLITQVLAFLIGVPTLIYLIVKIRSDKKQREKLFDELDKNNREHLFNPGEETTISNEKDLITNAISTYKNAAEFITEITEGNLDVEWKAINSKNIGLNETNLAGKLIKMREKMKQIREEEERRSWVSEGIAKFSEVIRNYQHDMQELSHQVLVFIVKYMNAQQGGFFVVRRESDETEYLDLTACFAFNRKKHISKRLEIGEGLVGQTYLEQETTYLLEIPQGYTYITSGLGDVSPNCLLIVPMKYNDKVEAIVEIASLSKFEQHQIEFLERLGEIIASTLGSVKNNEITKRLLDQFKVQTEQLKAQEEELRQNMEEMEATQEALRRQEKQEQVN
jgi:CHASE3 domain sensor protein